MKLNVARGFAFCKLYFLQLKVSIPDIYYV